MAVYAHFGLADKENRAIDTVFLAGGIQADKGKNVYGHFKCHPKHCDLFWLVYRDDDLTNNMPVMMSSG